MELWYTEEQTSQIRLSCKIKETLYTARTQFQELAVIDTEPFGRMLVLDGMVQTCLADEFVYHEMIAHVPLFAHPEPKQVLVIGGGDGGAIREVLKHTQVERAVLAEIDGEVIESTRRFLPEIAGALDDHRVDIQVVDGISYLKQRHNEFDCILVDSTEPVGPAIGLFSQDFYQSVFDALKPDGLMVAQTESPFYNQDILLRAATGMRSVFGQAATYLASIPTYPSGLWSFTMASKKYQPGCLMRQPAPDLAVKYYTPELHKASFELPLFVRELLGKQ
ncbi:MAG: polyamine aminopropyltransferase [Firmicutes bacterium]|nr:polyamine aminopropyltransferase [Bacillota bacterium]